MEITPDLLKRMRACTDLDMPSDAQIALLDHVDALQQQVTALAAANSALKTSAGRLVESYIANKGTDSEFISCHTPGKSSIGSGGVWDKWREMNNLLESTPETAAIQNEWAAKGAENSIAIAEFLESYAAHTRAGDKP